MVDILNSALKSHTSTKENMATAVSELVQKLSRHLPSIDITETITQVLSNFARRRFVLRYGFAGKTADGQLSLQTWS